MSYILDAIKKTESGQKDGDVPNLNSEHQHAAFIEDTDNKRWILPLLVVIAILAAVVIWLLLKPENQLPVSESAVMNHQPIAQEKEPQLTPTETITQEPAKETVNETAPVKQIKSQSDGLASNPQLVIKKAPLEVKQPVVQKQPESIAETVSRRPVTEVVQDSVQQPVEVAKSNNSEPVFLAAIDHDHWPTLIYTTHIYATEPGDRFVMLNGKAYSIGDTITKGMVIADIMENDLLVEYQGQKVIVPGLTDVNP